MAGLKRKIVFIDGVEHRRCTNINCAELKPESEFRSDQGICRVCYNEKRRILAYKYNDLKQARIVEQRKTLSSSVHNTIPRLKCGFCENTCSVDELESWVLIVKGYEYDLEGAYEMCLPLNTLYDCLKDADIACDFCVYEWIERISA